MSGRGRGNFQGRGHGGRNSGCGGRGIGTTRAPNPNIPPANKKEYNFAPQSSGSSNYATLNSTKKVIIQEVQSEYDSGNNAAQSLKPSKRNIQ